jgi:hypothetical protein
MSLDLIEFVWQMEDVFGVEISSEELEALLARQNRDIRAGDLYDLVQTKGPTKRSCHKCRYDLRGHISPGTCPECGQPFDDWERFCRAIAEICDTTPNKMTPDSLLIRDFEKHW